MTTSTATRHRHRYLLIGTTFSLPRDCVDVGYRVEYSARTRRARITYETSWQGTRGKTWYIDDASEHDARELLHNLAHDPNAGYALGEPARKSAPIR